jgi:hypothetical protein
MDILLDIFRSTFAVAGLKNVSLFVESLQVFDSACVQHYLSRTPHPKLNYDMVTGPVVEVILQLDRVAQVTTGEFTITENLPKKFPNSEFVTLRCHILLESHIVLNTRLSQLRHEHILRHVQVHVLINRSIIVARTEQSKL